MKKALLAALAVAFTLGAAAQNRAIDRLAEKYADRDGYTVVNFADEALHSIVGMISAEKLGESRLTLDDGTAVSLADLLRDITAMTVVMLERPDEAFAADIRRAVKRGKYSVIASINIGSERVQLLSADTRSGERELVATMLGENKVLLARIVGNIDMALLARLGAAMQD